MTWAFRHGEFRGIPFYVDTSARTSGRALVAHEIPHGRGEVWEDVGPELDVLAFDAYLVAPHTDLVAPFLANALGGGTRPTRATFYEWRDKLLEALESPGAATLIHPTFGSVLARARRWSFQESRGEQFFLRFALEFVRDREQDATVEEKNGKRQATRRFVGYCGQRIYPQAQDRIVTSNGTIYQLTGWRNADRLDLLMQWIMQCQELTEQGNPPPTVGVQPRETFAPGPAGGAPANGVPVGAPGAAMPTPQQIAPPA